MNEILAKENLVEPTKMLRLLPISENVKLQTRIIENGPLFDQQQKNSVIFTNFQSILWRPAFDAASNLQHCF